MREKSKQSEGLFRSAPGNATKGAKVFHAVKGKRKPAPLCCTVSRFPAAGIVALTALALSACVSTKAPSAESAVVISLTGYDQVDINNRRMSAKQLANHLQAQGIEPDTMIRIHRTTGGNRQDAMAHLIGILRAAGYSRVIFVSERQIEIEVP